jgi:hypothetical protein
MWVLVGIAMDEVVLGLVFVWALQFFAVSIILPVLAPYTPSFIGRGYYVILAFDSVIK